MFATTVSSDGTYIPIDEWLSKPSKPTKNTSNHKQCELCRSRKSRCDGSKPKCKLCVDQNRECVYREPGVKLDAGDKLILERLDRIEGIILQGRGMRQSEEPGLNMDPFLAGQGATLGESMRNARKRNQANSSRAAHNEAFEANRDSDSTNIKVHMTPALHLLQWPKIRDLVSRSYDAQLLSQLEMAREPLQVGESLSLEFANSAAYIVSFFQNANVWYACVDPATWIPIYQSASSRDFREGPESCLVLLVLALGNASSADDNAPASTDAEPPGMQYFSAAWGLIPSLIINYDILSSQCIILASAYLLYLVRPIEAWTLLGGTAMKLQLLLTTPDGIPDRSKELGLRVVWNAILFECDLVSELDLPQSNLVNHLATLDLPNHFASEQDGSTSSIAPDEPGYLQATIFLRRIQTRINQAIYSASAPTSTTALEPLVAALDADLSEWYSTLPFHSVSSPSSGSSTHPVTHPAQSLLRLRYDATRALIFRPYLLAALSNSAAASSHSVRAACHICLESCMRALEHVADYRVAHLPYLWQGGLALTGMALLVMGAREEERLAVLLPGPDQVNRVLEAVVREVEALGTKAPSLKWAGEVLREANARKGAAY